MIRDIRKTYNDTSSQADTRLRCSITIIPSRWLMYAPQK